MKHIVKMNLSAWCYLNKYLSVCFGHQWTKNSVYSYSFNIHPLLLKLLWHWCEIRLSPTCWKTCIDVTFLEKVLICLLCYWNPTKHCSMILSLFQFLWNRVSLSLLTFLCQEILLKFLQNWNWRKGRDTCSLSFVQVLVLISILAPHADWGTSLSSLLPQPPAGCCCPVIVFSLAPETPILSCLLGMGYWIYGSFTSNWAHHLLSQTSLFCGCALPHRPSQKPGHIRFIPYFTHPPPTKSF